MSKSSLSTAPRSATHSESSTASIFFNSTKAHLWLIAILGIIVYSNTLHSPFILDDNSSIVYSTEIKHLSSYFTPDNLFDGRYLGKLSLALNYYFGGLHTFGYHIVNIAIHLLTALLV